MEGVVTSNMSMSFKPSPMEPQSLGSAPYLGGVDVRNLSESVGEGKQAVVAAGVVGVANAANVRAVLTGLSVLAEDGVEDLVDVVDNDVVDTALLELLNADDGDAVSGQVGLEDSLGLLAELADSQDLFGSAEDGHELVALVLGGHGDLLKELGGQWALIDDAALVVVDEGTVHVDTGVTVVAHGAVGIGTEQVAGRAGTAASGEEEGVAGVQSHAESSNVLLHGILLRGGEGTVDVDSEEVGLPGKGRVPPEGSGLLSADTAESGGTEEGGENSNDTVHLDDCTRMMQYL
ncbi:tail tape measure, putative [Babesia ovata]|uniref:Tail tape measure, putative n=1 Tax=Babesia ovata TaxID=189622 RepID=A0A2H6KAP0_9APIC|nr:tail tape measure, putative [Babesia ovata]GBE60061.1 tail tape measure, putative [Babesia ovata]